MQYAVFKIINNSDPLKIYNLLLKDVVFSNEMIRDNCSKYGLCYVTDNKSVNEDQFSYNMYKFYSFFNICFAIK